MLKSFHVIFSLHFKINSNLLYEIIITINSINTDVLLWLTHIHSALSTNGGKCMDGFELNLAIVNCVPGVYPWVPVTTSAGPYNMSYEHCQSSRALCSTEMVWPSYISTTTAACYGVYNCNISSTPDVHFTDLKHGAQPTSSSSVIYSHSDIMPPHPSLQWLPLPTSEECSGLRTFHKVSASDRLRSTHENPQNHGYPQSHGLQVQIYCINVL